MLERHTGLAESLVLGSVFGLLVWIFFAFYEKGIEKDVGVVHNR